jgi:hypothetical protein
MEVHWLFESFLFNMYLDYLVFHFYVLGKIKKGKNDLKNDLIVLVTLKRCDTTLKRWYTRFFVLLTNQNQEHHVT